MCDLVAKHFALEQRDVDFIRRSDLFENLRTSKENWKRPGYSDCMRRGAVPTVDMMVDNVMRRWPPTIRVFLDFRMLCVGCPIAAFHSIEEACGEHGVDASVFVSKLADMAKAA